MTVLSRQTVYNGLLSRFSNSPIVGTVPADGARYGIVTGSAAEYARFGTAFAQQESSFNANEGPPNATERSYGLFQYDHTQVPGGNAFNPYASMDAFVRDTTSSVTNAGRLNGGPLGALFSQTTFRVAGNQLSGAGSIADGPPDNAQGSTPANPDNQTGLGMEGQGADAPTSAGTGAGKGTDASTAAGTGGAGAGAGAGTGAGTGAGAGAGQAIPINLQVLGPGTTQPITGWIKTIMGGFGGMAQTILTGAENAVANYFAGITNWFVRAFLILLGIIIIAIGLIVLMWDHGGQQAAVQARKVLAA